jgi:hypothetical protein
MKDAIQYICATPRANVLWTSSTIDEHTAAIGLWLALLKRVMLLPRGVAEI